MVFLSKTVKKKKKFGIMAKELDYPIRMCIICKKRFKKIDLFRFQIKDGKIVIFSGTRRSFYLCKSCIFGNEKRLIGILKSRYKINSQADDCVKKLKEMTADGWR